MGMKWDNLVAELKKVHIEAWGDGVGNFGFSYNGYPLGSHTDGDQWVRFYTYWRKWGKKSGEYTPDHVIGVVGDDAVPWIEYGKFFRMPYGTIVQMLRDIKGMLLKTYPIAKTLKQSSCGGPVRRNLFIVFEGVDNSGKTTISKLLRNKMKWFKWSKEPCFSTKKADFLNSDAFKGKDAAREVKYLKGRIDRQEFYRNNPVILDRYLWSGIAYAKTFSPTIANFCEALYTDYEMFKKPDLMFFMRTPLATCYDREPALKKTPGRLERIEAAYDATRCLFEPDVKIVEVDGRMDISNCVEFCYQNIISRFKDQVVV